MLISVWCNSIMKTDIVISLLDSSDDEEPTEVSDLILRKNWLKIRFSSKWNGQSMQLILWFHKEISHFKILCTRSRFHWKRKLCFYWFPPLFYLFSLCVVFFGYDFGLQNNVYTWTKQLFQATKSSATPAKVNKTVELVKGIKRPAENDNNCTTKDIKRIRPTQISSNLSKPKTTVQNIHHDDDDDDVVMDGHNNNSNVKNKEDELPSSTTTENPITEAFAKLIDVCR